MVMSAMCSDMGAAAEQGMVAVGTHRGLLGRLGIGSNEGDAVGYVVIVRVGKQATRSKGKSWRGCCCERSLCHCICHPLHDSRVLDMNPFPRLHGLYPRQSPPMLK